MKCDCKHLSPEARLLLWLLIISGLLAALWIFGGRA